MSLHRPGALQLPPDHLAALGDESRFVPDGPDPRIPLASDPLQPRNVQAGGTGDEKVMFPMEPFGGGNPGAKAPHDAGEIRRIDGVDAELAILDAEKAGRDAVVGGAEPLDPGLAALWEEGRRR